MKRVILACFALFAATLVTASQVVAQDTVWTRWYSQLSYGNDILETPDGDYVVVGNASGMWLMKVTSLGEPIWSKKYFTEGTFSSVCLSHDGGYIAAGNSGGFLLCKTDSSGDTLWTQLYGQGD
ncbi:MAG: hypothetical protein ABIK83_02715 [Candidatus Zixiibacteriota bacterium]